mgnify:FL=1
MEKLAVWLFENKEWLLACFGVVAAPLIGRIIITKRRLSLTQKSQSGDHSKTMIAGRDLTTGEKKASNDVEKH